MVADESSDCQPEHAKAIDRLWEKENVIAILKHGKLGQDTLKNLVANNVKVIRADLTYWWAETAKLTAAYPQLSPDKVSAEMSLRSGSGSNSRQSVLETVLKLQLWKPGRVHGLNILERDSITSDPAPHAKKVIYIDELETDALAALTLVHEYTHFFQGSDEFTARKSEVEFLVQAPQLLTQDALGQQWFKTYTEHWLTNTDGQWTLTPANEKAIKDFVQRLDPPGQYTYWTNANGYTVYSFANLRVYQGRDWEV